MNAVVHSIYSVLIQGAAILDCEVRVDEIL